MEKFGERTQRWQMETMIKQINAKIDTAQTQALNTLRENRSVDVIESLKQQLLQ